jgi:hypothetical protein
MESASLKQWVSRWEVYYLWLEAMRPEAKYKFVVIAHVEDGWVLGLVVNSRVNAFYADKPILAPCHAPIDQASHGFLDHDSFVDCTEVFVVPSAHLSADAKRGELSEALQAAVLRAVADCPKLKIKHRKLILGE